MELFDVRTILLFVTLLLLARAAVMIYTWILHPSYAPTRDWALGSTMIAAGVFLVSLRDLVPLWLSAFGGNLLVIPGWMIVNFGTIRAAGYKPPLVAGALMVAVSLAVLGWHAMVDVNIQMRTIATALTTMVFDLVMAAYCFRAKMERAKITLAVFGGFTLLSAAGSGLRLYHALAEPMTWVLSSHWANVSGLLLNGVAILINTGFYCLLASQWLQGKIDDQAKHDPLTGAFNRRGLTELAARELERVKRSGEPVSFLMMDIDYFKRVNDSHGHDVGDLVLREVSRRAQQAVRPIDVWCRYGGEEFVAMLPRTNLSSAEQLAQRLRTGIETMDIPTPQGPLKVTVSLGVAQYHEAHGTWANTVTYADEAMYQAKKTGRNKVCVSTI